MLIDFCVGCRQGLVNTLKRGNSVPACLEDPDFIKNCFLEENFFGNKVCTSCKGGVPSVDKKGCRAWKEVKNPISNCDMGALLAAGQFSCVICSTEFVWNEDTQACVSAKGQQGAHRCLDIKKDGKGDYICEACDVFSGYNMRYYGKCEP